MFDFVKIAVKDLSTAKKTVYEIYPEFIAKRSKDLMVRGKSFYAVWVEEDGLWSQDEYYIARMIDGELERKMEQLHDAYPDAKIKVKFLSNFSSNKWTEWQKYIKSLPDNYHELDTRIAFANTEVKKTDYISKRLPYDLVDGSCDAYDELMSVLYSPEERQKLEWAVGSIIAGDSIHIQKFMVLYGPPKSGKSTFLHIVEKLFTGYYTTFEAKALGSVNNPFALEAFKNNPLIAIQHDGDLSRIADNTKINQIVSHEDIVVNEKFKATYATHFNSFLFLGTNNPVKITNSKSGIIRRLIDVKPTGDTIPKSRYDAIKKQIKFELGAIANHCLKVYSELGESAYDGYVSKTMIIATNDIYDFLSDYRFEIKLRDEISFNEIWRAYLRYCESANIQVGERMKQSQFKEEISSYFKEHKERTNKSRNVYRGFLHEKFEEKDGEEEIVEKADGWLEFNSESTVFDDWCKDKAFKAQYPKKDGTPKTYWSKVNTTMEDIDRSKLHYILIPEEEGYLRLDFDLKDEKGNKCLEKNIAAANEYPPTYAEISKSGGGVHLYYIYDGDQHELPQYISPDIEIKTTYGTQPIRRKFTKCNGLNVAMLHVGSLPTKERRKEVVDIQKVKNDKHLRNLIIDQFKKKSAGETSTNQACNFIYKVVEEEAYKSGLSYDIRDLEKDLRSFANNSTNHSASCTKLFAKMHLCSDDMLDCSSVGEVDDGEKPIVIFDVEVFPNVFILCWKILGDNTVFRLINPRRSEVAHLIENYRLVGFNNRKYDNHIIYAYAYLNYSNYELYIMSQSIIVTKKGERSTGFIGKAYNLSYLDLYDLASNPNKKSLKKWEIQLHAHHQENAYDWNQDLPEDKWNEVADYCENDVKATELVYQAIAGDIAARLILSAISGLLPNDTTNNQSMQIIFGDDKHPQDQFIYTDLSTIHPGYEFKDGVSTYKGYEVGEGGLVWALPGIYRKVKTFDVASMHPSSLIWLNLFGPVYTQRFKEIKDARLAVKHKDRDALKTLLGGTLLPFYDVAVIGEEYTLKDLANALKTVINSVYGLTAAKFENRCRDPRNIDNIVAKAGALFMVDLKEEVEKRGGKVVHIKTDSIKVVNPTPELEQFIVDFGKQYGYDFEVESVYDRFCLVNDAVYIAKEDGEDGEWTATGAEFAHPYIFKTLFSHEEIDTYDLGEVKNVSTGELYLDFNEGLGEDHNYQFIGKISEFLPVKDGVGGAELMVKRGEKYSYVSGTKGIRWMEAEYIRDAHKEDYIDMNYYDYLCEKVKEHINEFGDFDRFVNDDDYDPELERCINVPIDSDEEVPFDEDKKILVA